LGAGALLPRCCNYAGEAGIMSTKELSWKHRPSMGVGEVYDLCRGDEVLALFYVVDAAEVATRPAGTPVAERWVPCMFGGKKSGEPALALAARPPQALPLEPPDGTEAGTLTPVPQAPQRWAELAGLQPPPLEVAPLRIVFPPIPQVTWDASQFPQSRGR
jgi:hypothetical protein